MTEKNIGISEISVTAPHLRVSAAELSKALGMDGAIMPTEKIEKGLGIKSIILPSFAESNVTFVADNLYNFIKRLVADKEKLARFLNEPVKTIYYSSESNPDRSRPELEVALELVYSKLIDEDEQKYRLVIETLKKAMLMPTTYACVGGVMSIDQAVRSLGRGESALVIAADTAVYDSKLAPNAEATQGAGSTLLWITHKPSIARVHYEGRGAYHLAFSDFTKYLQERPVVYGKFSEIVYVYLVAKALEDSAMAHTPLSSMNFFVSHVPFPKQALYLASFLFVHELRNSNAVLFAELQGREGVGAEPLAGFSSLTELLESKIKGFNRHGAYKEEQEFIKYIENDEDIKRYWAWLSGIRKQPEFDNFVEALKIKDALMLPSQTGNVYSSAALQSFASLLSELAKAESAVLQQDSAIGHKTSSVQLKGVLAGYGSGAQGVAMPITINTTKEKLVKSISISINTTDIDAEQYIALHKWLIDGSESERSSSSGDLLEKTKELLRGGELFDGFYIIRRNIDGTGEYVYAQNGVPRKISIRY
ncbi:MAG: hypothetical protein ACP5UH_02890 [Candidatus Micrarchaeia archaeon]